MARRLRQARAAIKCHSDYPERGHRQIDTESFVGDTLSNLMHFCKSLGINFDACLQMAEIHTTDELSETGDDYGVKVLKRVLRRDHEEAASGH